jgi:hypothetical protein
MALSYSHMANRLIQFGRKNTTEQPKGYSSNHPKPVNRPDMIRAMQWGMSRPKRLYPPGTKMPTLPRG